MFENVTQLTFTSSKSTTEILNKSCDVNDVVLGFLLLTLNMFYNFFTIFSSASIIDFEQVNVRWVIKFVKNISLATLSLFLITP